MTCSIVLPVFQVNFPIFFFLGGGVIDPIIFPVIWYLCRGMFGIWCRTSCRLEGLGKVLDGSRILKQTGEQPMRILDQPARRDENGYRGD